MRCLVIQYSTCGGGRLFDCPVVGLAAGYVDRDFTICETDARFLEGGADAVEELASVA